MNIISHYIIPQEQIELLHEKASDSFLFGQYKSLDDILTTLGVDVVLEPGIFKHTIPTALLNAKEYWQEKLDECKKQRYEDELMEEGIREAYKNIKEIEKEEEALMSMLLRGLYDQRKKLIILYPEEMKHEFGGRNMEALLVSTLAHEAMHAYFNRSTRNSLPYVYHVEEPLAEFGMLLFLHETNSSYYPWALKDVSTKNTCYRYGAILMRNHLHERVQDTALRQYLKEYKILLEGCPIPYVDPKGTTIIMPAGCDVNSQPITIGGRTVNDQWQDLFKYPPRYFFDPATLTLGFDGDWSEKLKPSSSFKIVNLIFLQNEPRENLRYVYLGDHFIFDGNSPLRNLLLYYVIVSPANTQFFSVKGKLHYKKNNMPVI